MGVRVAPTRSASRSGYMIKTGEAARVFVDAAVRHVFMKQGILGVKVRRSWLCVRVSGGCGVACACLRVRLAARVRARCVTPLRPRHARAQVSIMLPQDPEGINGLKDVLPDVVKVKEPKEDVPRKDVHETSRA